MDESHPAAPPPVGLLQESLRLARFLTRLPLPVFAFEAAPHAPPDFDKAAPALPLVGALVGVFCAGIGALAYLSGISTLLAATLSVATGLIVTGGLHEDGFADCCDGFFGGGTPERRLEIMRDSRLGTFGAAGLMFSLLIRVLALAELFRLSGPAALLVLVGVAALARPLALAPALWLGPASAGGLARGVTMPGAGRAAVGMVLGLGLAMICAVPAELVPAMALAGLAGFIGVYALSRLAADKIGGYTGDVFGAAEQLAEIIALVVLSSAANWHGPV
ncbi:MAG: adenosylcobinamide-GDP ribazoletransferase [Proteobacteria bacterium]|nr:adenosylcobinamide-GDP ribazoletransferase [Pseudomonadota bacterium]